ncbi:MAG: PilZ domain-containing protein [Acidobacteriota bacterium]|jgi:hypothetical protein
MIDRAPTSLIPARAIRLHAWYRSAGSLLRELSRALNQGQTLLRADSGLPVGTHLVLVMSTECLTEPIEVQGTVTSYQARGDSHEMTLRYDFDPGRQRGGLDEALAGLRAQTRRPRRTIRIPLTLSTDSAALARGLEVTVIDASRSGARLRVAGERLPAIVPGDRLVMRHQGHRPGMRRPLRLVLEVRWTGARRRSGRRSTQVVGGRFVKPSESVRKRLRALLRFEEARPQVRLLELESPPATGRRSSSSRGISAVRRRGLKR